MVYSYVIGAGKGLDKAKNAKHEGRTHMSFLAGGQRVRGESQVKASVIFPLSLPKGYGGYLLSTFPTWIS